MSQAAIKKVSGEDPVKKAGGDGPVASKEPLAARAAAFARSTVGAKILVAATGLGLVLFLVLHLAGNLLMFAGRDAMNGYAAALKAQPALLWGARGGLLAIFLVHVFLAIDLSRKNRRARPIGYSYEDTVQASWASRHMLLTGLLVLFYTAYHLAHFTFGFTRVEDFALMDPLARHDVYGMVVRGFEHYYISGIYLAAMVVTALHVSHGFGSLWRSIGVSSPRLMQLARRSSNVLAVLLALGFSSIPIAVLTGFITFEGGAP